ncbi:MAG: SCO family protein [Nitrospirae bacterium]|nr:SCO family protein [Nitrospirota bacterium]
MRKILLFIILILFLFTFSCSREEKQVGILDIAGNVERREGEPAPDFSLTDQNGKKVSLKDFNGKLVLINFIYTNCKSTCPPLLLKFKEIQLDLKDEFKKQITLLSVSFDTEKDTPEALKKFAETQGADPSLWRFLTGSQAEIDKVLRDYHVTVMKGPDGEFGHVNLVVMIDKNGKRRYNFYGYDYPSEKIIERIHEVLKKRWF